MLLDIIRRDYEECKVYIALHRSTGFWHIHLLLYFYGSNKPTNASINKIINKVNNKYDKFILSAGYPINSQTDFLRYKFYIKADSIDYIKYDLKDNQQLYVKRRKCPINYK